MDKKRFFKLALSELYISSNIESEKLKELLPLDCGRNWNRVVILTMPNSNINLFIENFFLLGI